MKRFWDKFWDWVGRLFHALFPDKEYEKPFIEHVDRQKFYPEPKVNRKWKPTPPRGFGPDWRKL